MQHLLQTVLGSHGFVSLWLQQKLNSDNHGRYNNNKVCIRIVLILCYLNRAVDDHGNINVNCKVKK